MPTLTILAVILFSIFWVGKRRTVRMIDANTEWQGKVAIAELDNIVDDDGGPLGPGDYPVSGRMTASSRIVQRAVAAVRNKVGLLKRNEANSLVVRKLVVEYLDSLPDLRKTHQLAIVPLAVELSFVPTKYDIMARDIAGSRAAVERREDYGADRAYSLGWGPLGLLSRRRVVTHPPGA